MSTDSSLRTPGFVIKDYERARPQPEYVIPMSRHRCDFADNRTYRGWTNRPQLAIRATAVGRKDLGSYGNVVFSPDRLPQPPLLLPIRNRHNRPQLPLRDRILAPFHRLAEQDWLLNLGSQIEQIGDLCDSGPRDVPEAGQFHLVGHHAVADQTLSRKPLTWPNGAHGGQRCVLVGIPQVRMPSTWEHSYPLAMAALHCIGNIATPDWREVLKSKTTKYIHQLSFETPRTL